MTTSTESIPPPLPIQNRIAVVVNGNAKSVSGEVIETLDQILDSGDLFVSRRIEDSKLIAQMLVDRGYGTILTGGGDGTFTIIVTAIVHEARRRNLEIPRFGLLRLGTGNSLAWVLGSTPLGERGKNLEVDLQRLKADAGSRLLHLVESEGVLSPFCGFGLDAAILKDYNATKSALSRGILKNIAPGALSYAISITSQTIPKVFLKKSPHCRIINEGRDAIQIGRDKKPMKRVIQKGEVLYDGPYKIVALSTIPYYGFGFRMFPFVDDYPGTMQLRISDIRILDGIRKFPSVWSGEVTDSRLSDFMVDEVSIEVTPSSPFQIGGDIQGDRAKVRIKVSEPLRIVDFYAPPRGQHVEKN